MYEIISKKKDKGRLLVRVKVHASEPKKTPNRIDSRLILNSLDESDRVLIIKMDSKTVKSSDEAVTEDFIFYLK